MKTKQELIDLLKTDVQAFNKFREENSFFKIDLSGADLTFANLSGADLTFANLSGANLSGANLSGANLSGANLSGANLYGAEIYCANLDFANLTNTNLKNAHLTGANLTNANLTDANLTDSNLDFSSWPLQYGSLKPKTDERQRVQLFFHAASLIKHAEAPTEEEIEIYNHILKYVNKFHRTDVEKLVEIR